MKIFEKVGRLLGFNRPELPEQVRRRESLAVDEIRRIFYPDLKADLAEFASIWHEVSEAFYVPDGLMRPSDRFGIELPFWIRSGTTDEDLDLGYALTRRMKGSRREKVPEMATVDDYVRFAAKFLQT